MTKNKIAFAGFMGAILVSVGAANAATTSVATKGYVDQQVKTVETTIKNLDEKYITMQDVTDAIDAVDLSGYQTIANISQTLNGLSAEQKAQRYPSVAAVAEAIENLDLGLTTEQVTALQDLVKSDGVVSQLSALKGRVDTLEGGDTVEGSVAKKIADALKAYTKSADLPTYQAKSTADLQIGTTGGVFRDMTTAEKDALASGITSDKVTEYEKLVGDTGTIATISGAVASLEEVVGGEDGEGGLVKSVADNAAEIAKKIEMPEGCTTGNQTCVLMSAKGAISWAYVTNPVDDPEEVASTEE